MKGFENKGQEYKGKTKQVLGYPEPNGPNSWKCFHIVPSRVFSRYIIAVIPCKNSWNFSSSIALIIACFKPDVSILVYKYVTLCLCLCHFSHPQFLSNMNDSLGNMDTPLRVCHFHVSP